jgi:hypothetical protein
MRNIQTDDTPARAAVPVSNPRIRRRVIGTVGCHELGEDQDIGLYYCCITSRVGSVMDIYNAWFDLKPGVTDLEFSGRLQTYMDHLKNGGLMQGWRLMRRKLGLSAAPVGEFHLMMEFEGMAQLDQAFNRVGARREPVETVHFGVNSLVQNVMFALYRDFPDPIRHRGDEKF